MNTLTKRQFKIWLVTNGYTQKTLAEKLGITDVTISKYNRIERYPKLFIIALKALERDSVD